MKVKRKILICSITMLMVMCSYGQPYEPVISSDSTSWDIAWKELFGNVMGNLYSAGNEDTIYRDLYFQSFNPNAEYVGKIREDINTGKIWYTPPEYTVEYLIMDLSLTIGDTFELPVFNTTIPIEVIDVYYINQRKCIEFDYQTEWNEPLRFIEGVGRNIAMHHFWFGDFTYVACKYNLEDLVYVNSNPNFIDCELNPTGIKTINSNIGNVYPNPAHEVLNVDLNHFSYQDITISIFDDKGMEVYNRNTTNNHITIQLTTFNQGLYLIKISNKNNLQISKFIIR